MSALQRLGGPFRIGLTLLLLAVSGSSAGAQTNGAAAQPPSRLRIFFAEFPALLIAIDGDPVYRPIPRTDLERIVNTKAVIVREHSGIHYLKVPGGWMEAYTLLGEWSVSGVPPGAAGALDGSVDAAAVAQLAAADSIAQARRLDQQPPAVFISLEPAALIVTDGPARYETIDGTSLEVLANTTAKVFKEPTDQEIYVLADGRWFRSWRTDGPWDFVPSDELPDDIAKYARTPGRR